MDWNFFDWVGVAMFVLAIPLTIAGNILTPKFQVWWASTTKSRAERRVKSIPMQLVALDDCLEHPVTPLAQGLNIQTYGIILLVGGGFHLLSELILYGAGISIDATRAFLGLKSSVRDPKIWIGFGTMLVGYLLFVRAQMHFAHANHFNINKIKLLLRREEESLKKKYNLDSVDTPH